jgi:hypothetical protein
VSVVFAVNLIPIFCARVCVYYPDAGGMVEKAIKFEQSGGFKFALGVLGSVYAHNSSTGDWTFTEWCDCFPFQRKIF